MIPKQNKLTRRQLIRSGVYSGIFLSGGLGYRQSQNLERISIDVPIPNLPNPVSNFTIGILSDFHAGVWGNSKIIGEAIDLMQEAKPDIICLLGDYVDGALSHDSSAIQNSLFIFDELARLSAPLGIFAVLGNHDHWINAEVVTQLLEKINITVLDNQNIQLPNGLFLAGVDDYWEGPDKLQDALRGLEQDQPTILLSHNPDINQNLVKTDSVNLVLSGHTHGGQIRVPFCNWAPWVPCSPRYRGPAGLLWESKQRATFISKGVGSFLLPLRLFCPPDIAILKLTKKQER